MPRIRHTGGHGSILTAKGGASGDFVMNGPAVATLDISAVNSSQPLFANLSNDGVRLVVGVAPSQGRALQFTLSTPNDISTAVYAGHQFTPGSDLYGCSWSEDGSKLLACVNNSGVYSYSLSNFGDISTVGTGTFKSLSFNVYSMCVSRDGLRLFTYDITTRRLAQYAMSAPWGASTATLLQSVVTSTNYGIPAYLRGFDFSDDGQHIFMMDSEYTAYTFEMSTPWDLSTASIRSGYKIAPTLTPLSLSGTRRDGRFIGVLPSPSRLFQSDIR